MGLDFKNIFNKQAEIATSLNRGINKVIGKDVFQDVRPIEEPKVFEPYESYPEYTSPEPEQWSQISGESKEFKLEGNNIFVSKELDICFKYRPFFKQAAEYYTERFKFKYRNCVKDFDSFAYYFKDMYSEGLVPMANRAYSLLLPFGVFTADIDSFLSKHLDRYNRAYTSYEIMTGIEEAKNQAAEATGNQIGSAIQMQGGGFGFKGAMKGVAQAEAFNLGMGLFGKFVAHQSKMTQEEKSKVFAAFKTDLFFEEVYDDYHNMFLSFVQILIDNGIIKNVKTTVGENAEKTYNNIKNPMFPQDKVVPTLTQLISSNPFVYKYFVVLREKLGDTDEVRQIVDYFTDRKA